MDDWVLCRIYEKVDKGGNKNRLRNDEKEIEEAEAVQELVPYCEFEEMNVAEPNESYNMYFSDYQPNAYLTNPLPFEMDNQLQNHYLDFGMGNRLPASVDPNSIFTSNYSTRMGF